jgi:hypothetical protein
MKAGLFSAPSRRPAPADLKARDTSMGETTQEKTRATSGPRGPHYVFARCVSDHACLVICSGVKPLKMSHVVIGGHLVSRELRPCGLGL